MSKITLYWETTIVEDHYATIDTKDHPNWRELVRDDDPPRVRSDWLARLEGEETRAEVNVTERTFHDWEDAE